MPSELALWALGGALAAAFIVFFAIDALFADDLEEAAERTSKRFWSILLGAGGVTVTTAAVSLDAVLQVPALLIAALGIGSIIAGIPWELFAASSVVAYVLGGIVDNAR